MHYFVWGLVAAMIVAHQDFWFWDDPTLVFGLLPVGLFYHVVLSLVTAVVWFLATVYCWPADLEPTASPSNGAASNGAAGNDSGRGGP